MANHTKPSGCVITGNQYVNGINKAKERYGLTPKICIICSNPITYDRRERKTCSKECARLATGGYREGAGRSKSGRYRGISCDSLYELAFLIYNLDHDIPIERNSLTFDYISADGQPHKYLPDFRVNGVLVEIKGWDSAGHRLKIAAVTEPIVVVMADENAPYIDYVKSKSGLPYGRLVELYDASPHLYEKVCDCCGKTFTRANKSARRCSLVCSGKMVARISPKRKVVSPTGAAPVSPN